MDENIFVVRAPGKLSLLGEYAVLEENVTSVVAAISKYIYCQVNSLEGDKIIFNSTRIGIKKVEYQYLDKQLLLISELENSDKNF